jgi:hypothetical protein
LTGRYLKEHRLRVFENRVLRRIFEPKRNEVTGNWRKLHNEELHNLYSSPSIIRMIKSTGHVARMWKRVMHIGYSWESQKERDHWEDQDVGEWTILGWFLERKDGMDWTDVVQGPAKGSCEHGNEHSVSIECCEVLE